MIVDRVHFTPIRPAAKSRRVESPPLFFVAQRMRASMVMPDSLLDQFWRVIKRLMLWMTRGERMARRSPFLPAMALMPREVNPLHGSALSRSQVVPAERRADVPYRKPPGGGAVRRSDAIWRPAQLQKT